MKFSKEIVKKIQGYIRLGMRHIDAAHLAGIAETTFYEWERERPQFAQALKDAEVQGEAANLAVIHRAKGKQWQAAGWLLERRHPNKYSLRQVHELSGPGGGPIPVGKGRFDVSQLDKKSLEELNAKLDALLRPKS